MPIRLPDLPRRRLLLATAVASVVGTSACTARGAAPQVSYTLLDGSRGSTQALRGKVLLVNFWATSCSSCVKEMPQIAATHLKFASRGFETLAVAMSYDAPASVSHFAQTRGLPFGVVIDNTGAIAKAFGDVQFTPTTFLIDKRGGTARQIVGEPDFADLHRQVELLLAEA